MNENIAPKTNLDIQGRITEIQKLLDIQDKKVIKPVPVRQAPVPTSPPTNQPNLNGEMITLLKKITENQEIERARYERNNPIVNDDPIYDWAEATINPGQMVQFIYIIPEGYTFFLEYVNIVHNDETTYYVWIDGQYQPTLSYAIEDFGDHMAIWKPPKMCYNRVEVWALNNWVAAQTYACFFRGFNRFSRAVKREITYESIEKEKQET